MPLEQRALHTRPRLHRRDAISRRNLVSNVRPVVHLVETRMYLDELCVRELDFPRSRRPNLATPVLSLVQVESKGRDRS